jgi:hypothetical protein
MSHEPQGQSAGGVLNTTTAEEYRQSIRSKQESVKWLAGALAGAGLSLGLGLHVTNISALEGYLAWPFDHEIRVFDHVALWTG